MLSKAFGVNLEKLRSIIAITENPALATRVFQSNCLEIVVIKEAEETYEWKAATRGARIFPNFPIQLYEVTLWLCF